MVQPPPLRRAARPCPRVPPAGREGDAPHRRAARRSAIAPRRPPGPASGAQHAPGAGIARAWRTAPPWPGSPSPASWAACCRAGTADPHPPRAAGRTGTAARTRTSRPRLGASRSEEHTSELQSHHDLVCRLLLEKKKKKQKIILKYKKKKHKKKKKK